MTKNGRKLLLTGLILAGLIEKRVAERRKKPLKKLSALKAKPKDHREEPRRELREVAEELDAMLAEEEEKKEEEKGPEERAAE
ncbi:hypothetical protein HKBW3S03_02268 [Candidatus Hakubella thermalkaliphila]|uniref:Uncharacterized protein n=1 Tax=Candidatus Hakubella thermalkaliphila TaxID=2754717 RepID=A0A6V8NKB8_9ACTN|nr:hypothetical protein [Candidatus Hakubella thermalkaliphila]GFP20762.1 hypothetical protein HKBW3S03_02268 [Candidatus Hakubella thermalkaliphila]